jgi:hypothetical protein
LDAHRTVLLVTLATLLAYTARGAVRLDRHAASFDAHRAAFDAHSAWTARVGATATSMPSGTDRLDANSARPSITRRAPATAAAVGGTFDGDAFDGDAFDGDACMTSWTSPSYPSTHSRRAPRTRNSGMVSGASPEVSPPPPATSAGVMHVSVADWLLVFVAIRMRAKGASGKAAIASAAPLAALDAYIAALDADTALEKDDVTSDVTWSRMFLTSATDAIELDATDTSVLMLDKMGRLL